MEFDDIKVYTKGKFKADCIRFLNDAIENDDGGWEKHTEFHWSRIVAGKKLDYWPSRKKFQYLGKVRRGDVLAFVERKS
jgi:hypothetical protein